MVGLHQKLASSQRRLDSSFHLTFERSVWTEPAVNVLCSSSELSCETKSPVVIVIRGIFSPNIFRSSVKLHMGIDELAHLTTWTTWKLPVLEDDRWHHALGGWTDRNVAPHLSPGWVLICGAEADTETAWVFDVFLGNVKKWPILQGATVDMPHCWSQRGLIASHCGAWLPVVRRSLHWLQFTHKIPGAVRSKQSAEDCSCSYGHFTSASSRTGAETDQLPNVGKDWYHYWVDFPGCFRPPLTMQVFDCC